jgi:preprotein translocase subunit SecG
MNITMVLQTLQMVSAAGMIFFIMLHSPKGDGIGIGGAPQMFSSTKSAETALNRITWGLFVTFISMTVILSAGWLTPKG